MEEKKWGHRNPDPAAAALGRVARKALGLTQEEVARAEGSGEL